MPRSASNSPQKATKKPSKKSTKTSSTASTSAAAPVPRSKKASCNYVTPFTFEENRMIFGKAEQKTGTTPPANPGAASTTYTYYEPTVNYKYPNGTVGPLCLRIVDSVKMANLLLKKKSQTVKTTSNATKVVTFDSAAMGFVFEPNPKLGDVPRAKHDPECDDDTVITQKEILDAYISYYKRKLTHCATWISENIPEYDGKTPDFLLELAATSMPQHRKDRVTKKPIRTSPLQIYYELTSYTFLKDKSDIDSEIIKQSKIKMAATDSILPWADAADYTMWGDAFVEFNRLHVKTSNGWSLKGAVSDVVINDYAVKENISEQRSDEIVQEYKKDENVKQRMLIMEQELEIKRMRKLNSEQKKKIEGPSGSNQPPPSPPKTVSAKIIPEIPDADSDEDEMGDMSIESVIGN